MRILVLGGYGAMAQVIVRDLIESKPVKEVIIAGRDLKKAEDFANRLKSKKTSVEQIDVTDKNLVQKIKKLSPDVVINSTWYEYNMLVMPAVIEAGVHYLDLGGLYWKTLEQLKLDSRAKAKDITCILGVGSTPGITNVMAHHASHHFDRIDTIEISAASVNLEEAGFQAPYSIRTVMDEFTMKPVILKNERIKEIEPLSRKKNLEFTKPIGKVVAYPTLHSELATFPKIYKGVKNIEFLLAYSSEFMYLLSSLVGLGFAGKKPVEIMEQKIILYGLLTELVKRLPKPARDPRDFEILRVDMHGKNKYKKLFVRMEAHASYHERWKISAGTVDTGVPPSIIAQWIASGIITERGVLPPDPVIDDVDEEHRKFFQQLNKRDRGIKIYKTINNEKPKPLF